MNHHQLIQMKQSPSVDTDETGMIDPVNHSGLIRPSASLTQLILKNTAALPNGPPD